MEGNGEDFDKFRLRLYDLTEFFPGTGPSVRSGHRIWQHGDLDAGRIALRTVNPVRGFLVVRFLGFEDIRDKGLRVAVDDRKPSALDLNHDAMTFFDDVVSRVKVNAKGSDGAGNKGFGLFERIAESAPKHFVAHPQLLT